MTADTIPDERLREILERATRAIETERNRWPASAAFGNGRASGFNKAIEAVRSLLPPAPEEHK